MTCQSRLKVSLGTADIEVMTALKGETPKVTDGDDLGPDEMEDGEINAAVHGRQSLSYGPRRRRRKRECSIAYQGVSPRDLTAWILVLEILITSSGWAVETMSPLGLLLPVRNTTLGPPITLYTHTQWCLYLPSRMPHP